VSKRNAVPSQRQHLAGTQVWAIDGDGLVVRPGLRLVDGVEAIATILHPGADDPTPLGGAFAWVT
jgi:iron complex transport system substrate-binding protein